MIDNSDDHTLPMGEGGREERKQGSDIKVTTFNSSISYSDLTLASVQSPWITVVCVHGRGLYFENLAFWGLFLSSAQENSDAGFMSAFISGTH